jgi:ubiquinone/menaquinone biosynthesis C-methylase UbiE
MGLKLNLGASKDIRPYAEGWRNCDIARGPGIDVSFDANKPWPFPNEYFEEIYASHVLEHLWNLNLVMKEANRVLKPGGLFEVKVPYGGVSWSNPDPNHVRFFVPETMQYYLQGNGTNTTLEADWERPLFKLESCEVIRIFWQRERLSKVLGSWIAKRYVKPKFGIPVEIHFLLRKVS